MAKRRRTNATVAQGITSTRPDERSWQVFDTLPHEVRAALWEAPLPINPMSVAPMLSSGTDWTVEQIRHASHQELFAFGREHQAQHGYPLPHLAARARLQPYAVFQFRPSSASRLKARSQLSTGRDGGLAAEGALILSNS
jgi:hypothetical protein